MLHNNSIDGVDCLMFINHLKIKTLKLIPAKFIIFKNRDIDGLSVLCLLLISGWFSKKSKKLVYGASATAAEGLWGFCRKDPIY